MVAVLAFAVAPGPSGQESPGVVVVFGFLALLQVAPFRVLGPVFLYAAPPGGRERVVAVVAGLSVTGLFAEPYAVSFVLPVAARPLVMPRLMDPGEGVRVDAPVPVVWPPVALRFLVQLALPSRPERPRVLRRVACVVLPFRALLPVPAEYLAG